MLTLGRKVMSIISAYGPQSGRTDADKVCFYIKMVSEWNFESSSKIIVSLGCSVSRLALHRAAMPNIFLSFFYIFFISLLSAV